MAVVVSKRAGLGGTPITIVSPNNWLSIFANRIAGYGNTTRTNGTNHEQSARARARESIASRLCAHSSCFSLRRPQYCSRGQRCRMKNSSPVLGKALREKNALADVWFARVGVSMHARNLWQYSIPIGDDNLQIQFADLERKSGLVPPVNWTTAVQNYISLKNMSLL